MNKVMCLRKIIHHCLKKKMGKHDKPLSSAFRGASNHAGVAALAIFSGDTVMLASKQSASQPTTAE